ncbi:MAG: hypothetical protein CMB32_05885 [Euryarchaeota archaeon]|nr:hypothetical protein [Euryarchaeota archaeon]|tara:strand:- start:1058 stop:2311 length:1254 start_codon:yes stop_codon:yes gene_type:complete
MRKLVRPFRLVQPPRHLAHLVASRSYLSYDKSELQDKLVRNPYSYLQVINPDAKKEVKGKRGTKPFFRAVRDEYDEFLAKGWLEGTDGPGYVIYRQTTPEKTYTGVVCVLDLERAKDGDIKIHEQTLETREELFVEYLENVGFHAEPILCARKTGHPGESKVDLCIDEIIAGSPATCDFSTTDRIRHSIWWVNKDMDHGLSEALAEMDKVYLADGHHRLASSLKLMHRYSNEPGVDRILAFVIPAEELNILGFHREVLNWKGDVKKLLAQITAHNSVVKVSKLDNISDEPHIGEIDVIFGGEAHRIVLKRDNSGNRIDAQWLGEEVIEKVLDITDPRNNPDLKYIPGTESREDIVKREGNLMFCLHPIPVDQITNTADEGGHLPPKSTWVEPKLRSGLFVYEFGNHDHPEYKPYGQR